ncbi:galactose ABC transporter substrate-binding protein [Clostridium cellulovorans]|uniref:D-galactose/methyl-galactoside binding periplasmic protein MglB n=1 Tax=Clostridium cellulovorans (strain ATCC 35296 / DSM 3052 / OCM 3 / 743B) TaxID=573061 RepID=D9ST76_CLOC7|nr:galactose ABC transporter substrate-binding protein [Clostridium cellulovorans]ADL50692.1 periplasmic binding protein/LacI transcriptional regulator [Clostridium cellulovorans 743B]
MNLLKRTLTLTITLIFIIVTLTSCGLKTIKVSSNVSTKNPIKVGILLYSFEEMYLSLLKKSLEDIEKENTDKVEFTFFDGKANSAIQYQLMDEMINKNFDLIFLNIFESKQEILEDIIYRAKQKNIALILFLSTIPNLDIMKSYSKIAIIAAALKDPPVLEGQIIVDEWKTNKKIMDKNGDNILQYVMLKGKKDSTLSDTRTKYSLETIKNAGIQTDELSTVVCNWNRETAKDAITSLFLRYGPKIEAIIANNDTLAIGAIEGLQKYGYNKGNKSKTIPVVGIDALPEAQELIKKGFMLGSVFHNPRILADTIYTVGMNLVNEKKITEGTNYKLDSSGIIISAPFEEYTLKSIPKTD